MSDCARTVFEMDVKHTTTPADTIALSVSANNNAASSRKRKREDGSEPDAVQEAQSSSPQPSSRKQCLARLAAIEENIQCPVCLQTAFCPFLFPCGEHIACFRCIVQLVVARCPVELDSDCTYGRTGFARCPKCNSDATTFDENLKRVQPLPHLVINSFFFPEDRVHPCPYCPHRGTMANLCRHLKRECRHVSAVCGFCSKSYALSGLDHHIEQECAQLPCPWRESVADNETRGRSVCSFRSGLAEMKLHVALHAQADLMQQKCTAVLRDFSTLDLSSISQVHLDMFAVNFRFAVTNLVHSAAARAGVHLPDYVALCGQHLRNCLRDVAGSSSAAALFAVAPAPTAEPPVLQLNNEHQSQSPLESLAAVAASRSIVPYRSDNSNSRSVAAPATHTQ